MFTTSRRRMIADNLCIKGILAENVVESGDHDTPGTSTTLVVCVGQLEYYLCDCICIFVNIRRSCYLMNLEIRKKRDNQSRLRFTCLGTKLLFEEYPLYNVGKRMKNCFTYKSRAVTGASCTDFYDFTKEYCKANGISSKTPTATLPPPLSYSSHKPPAPPFALKEHSNVKIQ